MEFQRLKVFNIFLSYRSVVAAVVSVLVGDLASRPLWPVFT